MTDAGQTTRKPDITLEIAQDSVVVVAPTLQADRTARLFFASIMGAAPTTTGWRCPRRNVPLSNLVVRINSFLESKGYVVRRLGAADDEIRKEIERKRSFQRACEAGELVRGGNAPIDLATTNQVLQTIGWQDTNRSLYPHQQAGVLHALSCINAANFSVPGSGKTTTTLAVAAAHIASGTIDVLIVVGPRSCFGPWEKET